MKPFDGFLAAIGESDRYLLRHVERDLRRFTTCGDPANGFAWLICDHYDHHRLVPFSRGGPAFCPSCAGRRLYRPP